MAAMGDLHLMEVLIRPCAFVMDVIEGSWRNIQEGAERSNGKKITYGFKVIGENKLVIVFNGGVENALKQLNSAYGDQIEVFCTPIRTYENFASHVLGLDDSLTGPSTRRLTNGDGPLFWLKFTIGYRGLGATELVNIWSREATALLTLRNKGDMELDLFKVIGQREVHLFVRAPNSDIMDDIIFTLPIMKELGDQIEIRTKSIVHLTTHSTH